MSAQVGPAPRGVIRTCGALVIGGDYRALGIVRSLGRHGIPVWVLTDQHRVASFSRYCRRALPWPAGDDAARVGFLLELANRHRLERWTIFPTADVTASFLARNHSVLSACYRLSVPPWEELRRAYDKCLIHAIAADVGVDQPMLMCGGTREDIARLSWPFPLILKPATKEGRFNMFTHSKAWRVDSMQELLARYDEAAGMVDPSTIMVQELVPAAPSSDYSFAALCDQGEPIASIVAWRARQYPIEFGRASSYVESVELPEVEEPARRLLGAMGFTGVIEVAFLKDARDGKVKLLDINPRAWGWHTLGRRSGVDFLFQYWQMLNGGYVSGGRARTGTKWIRLLTDLPTSFRMMRSGMLTPQRYLQSLRGPKEYAILAMDDPLPALVDAPILARLARKRGAA